MTLRSFPRLLGLLALVLGATAAQAQSDLAFTLDPPTTTVASGDAVTFTLTVANLSSSDVSNIVVTAPLPAGLTFSSTSSGAYASGTGVWTVGKVKKNKDAAITVTAIAGAGGTRTFSGSITGADAPDPTPGNNTAASVVTVVGPISPAPGVCYAVADAGGANGGDDWLIVTNRNGSQQSTIGTGTGTFNIEAAAYWPGTNLLYAADAGQLGTLSVTSGVFTARPSAFGTGGGTAGEIALNDADGLAFDPFTGVLYATHRRGTVEDLLFKVNTTTGAHIPNAFGPGVDYVVIRSAAAPTSMPDIDDIAIDPYDGTLFGIANGNGVGDRLIVINKATGAVTDRGALGQNDMEGLAFDAAATLFGTTGSQGGANSNSIFSVNKVTGLATREAAFIRGTDHEAVACLTDGVNTLGGTLFRDNNANGVYAAANDTPRAGVSVTLYRDVDGSGTVSDGDVALTSTLSGANGAYAFSVASKGAFVVAPTTFVEPGGVYTTPIAHAASFSTFGNTVSGLDVGYTTSSDLALTMTVSDPAPTVGDVVTFTVTVTHQAGAPAGDVRVSIPVYNSAIVSVIGSTPSVGAWDGTIWTVGALGVGQSRTLTIQVQLNQDLTGYTALAEISHMNGADIDSTPNNGITSEDDYASATASTGGASTAGQGGLESNGSMAQALASVLYGRRQQAAARIDAGLTAPTPLPMIQARMTQARLSGSALALAVPSVGPVGSIAVEVSPTDLLPVTNALDVVAADYLRADGRRVGAFFATATAPGEVYEHTKPVCDRLRGGVLDGVERLMVAGRPFVLTKLTQADGSVDYAVSFVVYGTAAGRTVDSRFLLSDYDTDAMSGDDEVLNFQVWGPSREYAAELVAGTLAELMGEGPLRFRNGGASTPALPDVFVRTGRYEGGQLVLDLYNAAGATSLRLTGGTLTRAEGMAAVDFSRTVSVPSGSAAEPFVTVAVETGALFDAAFFVETDQSTAPDRLYLADGTWGVALDPASAASRLDAFTVTPEAGAPLVGARRVERAVRVAGQMDSFATLYRTLAPGGLTADLSGYTYIEFDASGSGDVQVLLQQAAIATSDHFGTTVRLTPEGSRHRVYFEDLHLADGTRGFDGTGVVTLSLTARTGEEAAFALAVRNVRFGGAEGDAEAAPDEPTLLAPAPNPFASATRVRFDLAEAGRATLRVYDMLGREVARPVDGDLPAGRHTATVDGAGLAAGVYLVRLDTENQTLTQRMTRIR